MESDLWTVGGQMSQLRELWSFDFMRAAVAASLLLSLVGGYLAVFVVLRRIVFVTAAIAEFSACGVALALVRGVAETGALSYSLGTALLGVLLLSAVGGEQRLPRESIVGTAYAGAAAASVLILAVVGRHEGHELAALMWGDVLALSWVQVRWLAVALGGVALVHVLLYKEFLFCASDPVMARSVGFKTWAYDLLFFGLLGVAIPPAMHMVGLLVVFAYLVVPGVIGLLLGRTMTGAFVISIAAALTASVVGVVLSWELDLPTGLTVVTLLVGLVLPAAVIGRRR